MAGGAFDSRVVTGSSDIGWSRRWFAFAFENAQDRHFKTALKEPGLSLDQRVSI